MLHPPSPRIAIDLGNARMRANHRSLGRHDADLPSVRHAMATTVIGRICSIEIGALGHPPMLSIPNHSAYGATQHIVRSAWTVVGVWKLLTALAPSEWLTGI